MLMRTLRIRNAIQCILFYYILYCIVYRCMVISIAISVTKAKDKCELMDNMDLFILSNYGSL